MILGVVVATILGAKVVKEVSKQQAVTLVDPDMTPYLPMKPDKVVMGGGGGGGDASKIQAPKGKLPKVDMNQITPPAIVAGSSLPHSFSTSCCFSRPKGRNYALSRD